MKRILIIDDEQEIRELLKKRLFEKNFDVVAVSSALEAFNVIHISKPDIVLVDIGLPDMDGFQICENLRAEDETKNIPVLFLTGKDLEQKALLERLKQLGLCAYLPKPTSFEELLKKINEILNPND